LIRSGFNPFYANTYSVKLGHRELSKLLWKTPSVTKTGIIVDPVKKTIIIMMIMMRIITMIMTMIMIIIIIIIIIIITINDTID